LLILVGLSLRVVHAYRQMNIFIEHGNLIFLGKCSISKTIISYVLYIHYDKIFIVIYL
jgi:hypothetical protein